MKSIHTGNPLMAKFRFLFPPKKISSQVELGVSCQLDKQGGDPDDRGLMILPLTVSFLIINVVIFIISHCEFSHCQHHTLSF